MWYGVGCMVRDAVHLCGAYGEVWFSVVLWSSLVCYGVVEQRFSHHHLVHEHEGYSISIKCSHLPIRVT